MRYATANEAGAIELREDASEVLPNGAIALTPQDFHKLASGTHMLVGASLVPSPPTQPLPVVKVLLVDDLAALLITKSVLTPQDVTGAKK